MNDFNDYKSIQTPIGGRIYTLYVADEHEKRVKGLSGIRHLSKSEGMFLTFLNLICTLSNVMLFYQLVACDKFHFFALHFSEHSRGPEPDLHPEKRIFQFGSSITSCKFLSKSM